MRRLCSNHRASEILVCSTLSASSLSLGHDTSPSPMPEKMRESSAPRPSSPRRRAESFPLVCVPRPNSLGLGTNWRTGETRMLGLSAMPPRKLLTAPSGIRPCTHKSRLVGSGWSMSASAGKADISSAH